MAKAKLKINVRNGNYRRIKEFLPKDSSEKNRTFIGLAVEMKKIYNEVVGSGKTHVVFADRGNIPDMRAIPRTLKPFQAIVNCTGKKNLTMADLKCSCALAELILET